MSKVVRLPASREALSLYRDILRVARNFKFPNEQGELWSDVIVRSARQEFEQARYEKDPAAINQLLFVGRDCLMQLEDKIAAKKNELVKDVDASRTDRRE